MIRQSRCSSRPVAECCAALAFHSLLLASSAITAGPVTVFAGGASGTFVGPQGGVTTGVGTSTFTWGVGQPDVSSLSFVGKSFSVTTPSGYTLGAAAQAARPSFSIGSLNYHNGTIRGGTGADAVTLSAPVSLSKPVVAGPTAISARLQLINTPNTGDPVASADIVDLSAAIAPVTVTTAGGLPITVQPVGFGNATPGGFTQLNRFFVFEGASASADLFAQIASPCEAVVKGGVTLTGAGTPAMQATFKPQFGLKMSEAASLCGYNHFNWYQTVTADPFPPDARSNPGVPLTPPYLDPPLGGYSYQIGGDDSLPFYWGENGATAGEITTYTHANDLTFYDAPAESRLTGAQFIAFTTALVGVLPDNSWDALYAWNWDSNFNGTVGGVSIRGNTVPPDPGSGTGGVTILQRDLSAADIAPAVRALMVANGALNVGVAVPTPSGLILAVTACALLWMGRRFHGRT